MIENRMQEISEEQGIVITDELFQNETNPLTLKQAQEIEPRVALRWRYRICKVSGKTFDITKEGLFYTSGEYVVI